MRTTGHAQRLHGGGAEGGGRCQQGPGAQMVDKGQEAVLTRTRCAHGGQGAGGSAQNAQRAAR